MVKFSTRKQKTTDWGVIMAQLIIFREKSMMGMVAPMDCYVNGKVVCKVKNGEKVSCEVDNAVVGFKCNMYSNPMSDLVFLDLSDGKTLNIKIKQGAFKPSVKVLDAAAVVQATTAPSNLNLSTIQERMKIVLQATGCTLEDAQAALRTAGGDTAKAIKLLGGSDAALAVIDNAAVFRPTKEVGAYFAVDEKSRLWAVGKGLFPSLKNAVPYSYDDIVDFELIEDGSSIVSGGVGRAVVGGMLFGAVGAVVGGVTGKKKAKQTCTSLMVKITVNNTACPVEYIKLISAETVKNGFVYKAAFQNAQEIISLLQVICSQRSSTKAEPQTHTNSISPAEEIRKYKELLDDGIITDEEFQAKKKQLLGL